MSADDESRKMLVFGVAMGAAIGIFGNLWVGALLNFFGNNPTIDFVLFIIGFLPWLWALYQILKILPQPNQSK